MLLIDASVWVAALDRDDRFHAAARELVTSSDAALAALDLTLYEVANAVTRRIGRTEPAKAAAQGVLLACGGRLCQVDGDLIGEATQIATEHDLTVYDASYVAAARLNSWTLVSTDIADLVSSNLAVTPEDFAGRSPETNR
jgi:predicted nucleic acid-binding protein